MGELAPDLGLTWWQAGHADKQFQFTRMPIDSIGRVSEDTFTTTINLPLHRVFALTLDFGPAALETLLALVPATRAAELRYDLSLPFRQPSFLEVTRILVDFTAHLGRPQDESHVPLIVLAFAPPTELMGFDIVDPELT
jgi:hypothetical protein